MTSIKRFAVRHIKLDHIEPTIWRRVEVQVTTSLRGLPDVIQAVMLFEDYHLFEFNAGGRRYAVSDPEWDMGRETYAACNVRFGALVDRGITTFNYTYDFSDDWRHSITVEVVTGDDRAIEYPRFIDGDRRRPKMSAAFPDSRTSSTRWRSRGILIIAKSWNGMTVASSRTMRRARP